MSEQTLKEAIELVRSGNRDRARQVIETLLTQNVNDGAAWAIASRLSDSQEEAI